MLQIQRPMDSRLALRYVIVLCQMYCNVTQFTVPLLSGCIHLSYCRDNNNNRAQENSWNISSSVYIQITENLVSSICVIFLALHYERWWRDTVPMVIPLPNNLSSISDTVTACFLFLMIGKCIGKCFVATPSCRFCGTRYL